MFAVFPSARKVVQFIALPLIAVALAACDTLPGGGFGNGPSFTPGETVPVALLVPGGSGLTTDEILAQSLENAARLAMRDLNGASIDLRVYQTAGDATRAAALAQQAVDEGAQIILGPVYAASANAVGNAVADDGVTVLSFSNNAAIAGGNVFVLGQTFRDTANRMANFALSRGKQRFVIVHGQDSAGTQGRDAINAAVAAQGGTVVGSVDYALSQQGVIASISQIKSAVESNAADALFMTTDTASALPLLSQLLPEAGVSSETTQFMGLTRWDIPPQTLSLPGVQGGWFAGPDPAASATFSAQYQNAYGNLPHPIGGLAFDGVAAIGALVSRDTPNALSPAALIQGAGYRGASGIFRLRADGTNERGLAIATISNSQVTILSPAPQSFGGVGF